MGKSYTPSSLRQVLGLDAAHLKGLRHGVMIVLSAKDSDNKVVVVATGLVPKENYDHYSFFLRQCGKNS